MIISDEDVATVGRKRAGTNGYCKKQETSGKALLEICNLRNGIEILEIVEKVKIGEIGDDNNDNDNLNYFIPLLHCYTS